MIIKKIKLNNIRSYITQELILPEGSVLLSGDIGSGKSSILLAIEFALFGLRKGELSGASLLRNGKNSGSVELSFGLEKKDITIKRTLKREQDKIVQDSGYIEINGVKKEAMPVELKQEILALLNYPEELLTKSKAMIYRYTVYTPQESMKHILTEDKDSRLNALRRVFGVDKYKRIIENSLIVKKEINEHAISFEASVKDIDEIKENKTKKELEISGINERLQIAAETLKDAETRYKERKLKLNEIENKIKSLNELKKSISITESKIAEKEKRSPLLENEIKKLELEIEKIKKEITEEKDYNKEIKEKSELIENTENKIKESLIKISGIKTKVLTSKKLIEDISKLDICPKCKQKVTQEHKNELVKEESETVSLLEKEELNLTKNKLMIEEELKILKANLEKLKQLKQEQEIRKIRLQNLEDKTKLAEKYKKELQIVKDELIELKQQESKLKIESQQYKEIEQAYEREKLGLDKATEELKLNIGIKARLEQEQKSKLEFIEEINKTLTEKENIKNKLTKLKELKFWLEENFVKIIENIEKQVMFRLHSDFEALFQEWLILLIGEENLTAKLDFEFTPSIKQNGHEIEYEFLSGGEKTAIALAYRLALNEVINNLITTIKTKDLIILDEPTDGFSSEQLDRLQDVLEKLTMKQVIIVSHEAKIESFVNTVIRLNKTDHVSEIIS